MFMNRHFVERGNRVMILYLTSYSLVSGAYMIITQFSGEMSEANCTSRSSLPVDFYVDVQESPLYEIIFIIEAICLIGIFISVASVDTTSVFYIMVACGHLRSLAGRLQALQLEGFKDVKRHVVQCIVYHQNIIE